MTSRSRPPFTADERTTLLGWYQLQRELIPWKCEGLSAQDAHRVVVPTSPLMTAAGLVSHLRWTEHCWFEVAFHGTAPTENPQFDPEIEDLDFQVAGQDLDELVAQYLTQCRRSDEIIAAADLDDIGAFTGFPSAGSTLRWMITHMIEETARHAGQLDIIRELLDGRVGYY